jgi:hypothetical protein
MENLPLSEAAQEGAQVAQGEQITQKEEGK